MPTHPATVDRRLPALDGLRALAVAMVLAYHGGVPRLQVAGFYGVDVFFVLSGFLITRLLLTEQADRGRIRFAEFWARRARRLLPGLLLMLVAVAGYLAYAAPPGRYPGFRGDALSVVAYASNWHFIAGASNYFVSTGAPSLLTHTWSLAIEEQFYLVWPLVVWGAIRLARRTGRNPAAIVLAASGIGALASAGWMADLYRSGADPSRLYYGTDTHAESILIGCALAALTVMRPIRLRLSLATPAAALSAAGVAWAACSLGNNHPFPYEGGFLLVAMLAAALVVIVVSAPASPAARVLALPPLAYIGRISYGMYLWYFPLFAVLDRATTGLAGTDLLLIRCGADVAVAAASFHLLEQPIRRWRPRLRHTMPRRLPTLPTLPSGLGTLAAGAAAAVLVGGLVVADTRSAYPVSPTASPLAAATQITPPATGPGTRLLIFGDSTAATLGDDLALAAAHSQRVVIDVVPMFGCGLVMSAAVNAHGEAITPPPPCRASSPPPERWPARLRTAIAAFHPAVVLVATGRWEVESRRATPGGRWMNITEPQDAAAVRDQLQLAAGIVLGSHARLALATAPCFASGEQPNGDPWPEDSPRRLSDYNTMVRQVAALEAAAHPGVAGVVDLASLVCPDGNFQRSLDGATVRAPDGIHYPFFNFRNPNQADPDTLSEVETFANWIQPQILQQLAFLDAVQGR